MRKTQELKITKRRSKCDYIPVIIFIVSMLIYNGIKFNHIETTSKETQHNTEVTISEMNNKLSSMDARIETMKSDIDILKDTMSNIIALIMETSNMDVPIKKVSYSVDDISIPSNLTIEQLDVMLDDTWLEGYSEDYYNMEQTYGVNAIYAISVAYQETGWDINKSNRAMNYSNIYGIMGEHDYGNISNCIDYFGDFQKRLYIDKGIVSVENIELKYCPPDMHNNDGTWDTGVKYFMKYFYNKLSSQC